MCIHTTGKKSYASQNWINDDIQQPIVIVAYFVIWKLNSDKTLHLKHCVAYTQSIKNFGIFFNAVAVWLLMVLRSLTVAHLHTVLFTNEKQNAFPVSFTIIYCH